jgi:hypothetical protein
MIVLAFMLSFLRRVGFCSDARVALITLIGSCSQLWSQGMSFTVLESDEPLWIDRAAVNFPSPRS